MTEEEKLDLLKEHELTRALMDKELQATEVDVKALKIKQAEHIAEYIRYLEYIRAFYPEQENKAERNNIRRF
jgi:hypothetical protein